MSFKDGTIKSGEVSKSDRLRAWWEGYDISEFLKKKKEKKEQESIDPQEEIIAEDVETENSEDIQVFENDDDESVTEQLDKAGKPLWTSTRIGVAEKIWGQSCVHPYTSLFFDKFVKPRGIQRGMSVLDMSAGLGHIPRAIARDSRAWVIGLEESLLLAEEARKRSVLAKMSKAASIQAYNAENLKFARKFNYVFAIEKMSALDNNATFIRQIYKGIKSGGQFIFLDFAFEPDTFSGFDEWQKTEPQVLYPFGPQEMADILKKAGFIAMPPEDQTKMYRKKIVEGLTAFKEHLESVDIDTDTAVAIKNEIDLWKGRMQALESGLKVFLFHGVKK